MKALTHWQAPPPARYGEPLCGPPPTNGRLYWVMTHARDDDLITCPACQVKGPALDAWKRRVRDRTRPEWWHLPELAERSSDS